MSRELFKIVYDAPVMWRRINSIGIILDCNAAYARNLGYAKGEIVGRTVFEHVPAGQREAMNESLKEWFETGEVRGSRLRFKRRDGTEFGVLLDATSLFDSEGNLLGSNTVILDEAGGDARAVREFLDGAGAGLDSLSPSYHTFDEATRREFDGMRRMVDSLRARGR